MTCRHRRLPTCYSDRSSATIFSRSRAYSVVPTSVGAVHERVSKSGVDARRVIPVGVRTTRLRSPSSSRISVLPSACSRLARLKPRSRHAVSHRR